MNNNKKYIIVVNIYIFFLLWCFSDQQISYKSLNTEATVRGFKIPGYSLCLQFYRAIGATAVADLCVKY